jgi:hypothetical protein
MSTILKALRRLEEENSAQSQRPLREEVTRGPSPAKSRRGSWPLWVALLGLGVAAGAGAFTFWYLGRAPESAQPAQLAAAGSTEPREESAAAAKRPSKPRGAKPGRRRSSPYPAAAPSAASEPELPAAALASNVEVMKRPAAQPRIAAGEPTEPPASTSARSGQPRRMDPAEIPGRHKYPDMRVRSASASSIAVQGESTEPSGGAAAVDPPATSQVASATPVREARRRVPVAPEPRAEPPREVASDPAVVAVALQPERVAERAAPEPAAASAVAPARDAERRAAAPKPEPKPTAEESSKKPAKSSAAPRSSEIARAEIPDLRVERTVWHPIAERRVALIEFERSAERREIREGDAVGPLIVSKIEPSGVVFVHDGVEVRRRIGE